MAFRRIIPGRAPVQQSHDVDIEAFGEAPPDIEYTRDDQGELDAIEEVPDALAQLREETAPPGGNLIQTAGLITLDQTLVGKVSAPIPLGQRLEILTLKTPTDDINQVFTVTVGMLPSRIKAGGLAGIDQFDMDSFAFGVDTNQHPYALIEWGAGSSKFSAVVDIVPQQVISVSGSFLRVTGINNAPAGSPDIQIQTHVSLLPQPARKAATFTLPLGVINNGAAGNSINLPPFARFLKVTRADAAQSINFSFSDGSGNPVQNVLVAVNADCPEIPIPGTATFVSVSNTGAAPTRFDLIFLLGL